MNVTHHSPSHPDRTGIASSDRPRRRLSVNITPIERVGRMVIGLAAVVAGIVLLVSASSALVAILELLLIAAGLDLLVTGAIGHCPLYQRLGYVPRSLRDHK
jgi:hypothetical protein